MNKTNSKLSTSMRQKNKRNIIVSLLAIITAGIIAGGGTFLAPISLREM